nr:uncharacterized protein LOC122273166 [Parasteatoda tepidariorum]
MNKTLVIQWIPSHIGIEGNENADYLAKNGKTMPQEITTVTPDTLKKYVMKKLNEINTYDLTIKSKGKIWENIQERWKFLCYQPRKEAVTHFRLKTGHDCLSEHLYNIKILPSKACPICDTGVLNSDHLLLCKGLDRNSQKSGNVTKLYWEARNLMNCQ